MVILFLVVKNSINTPWKYTHTQASYILPTLRLVSCLFRAGSSSSSAECGLWAVRRWDRDGEWGGAHLSLHPAAIVAQHLALLAQVLRMFLALIRHVQPIRFLQGSLLVGVNINVALDALLPHVGPGVATHPFPLTLGALVFTEASLLPLIGGQPFSFGSSLGAVLDVVSFVEAEVA